MKMRNYLKLLFLTVLLTVSFGMSVSAEKVQKVVDWADLLSDEEEESLQEQLLAVSEQYQCDVAVLTAHTCEGKSPQDYTDDYYDEADYGYGPENDGIILMVSMGERKFHLATRGKAIEIFTDYGLKEMDERIAPYLTDGEYADAFAYYGELAGIFMEEYETTGQAFDVDHTYSDFGIGLRLLIACGVGLVVAVIAVVILFFQLRSVATESRAHEYVRDGSFRVTRERDIYLYRTVSKRRKEKESSGGGGGSSTHRTSGGSRAGGRTGSF